MDSISKIVKIVIVLAVIVTIGTVGFMILEDIHFIDALYMTFITISTVGFQEVVPLSTPARLFTVVLIVSGLGTAAYGFSTIVSLLFEGEVQAVMRRKKMESKIEKLNNHYILCGAGETGNSVIQQFSGARANYVVIEKDEEKFEKLMEMGILVVHGDATEEETLIQAKIYEAKGLIASLSKDTENVYTVLTARQLNPELYIVSRAISATSHPKLKRAGADNTISPNELGGARMASMVLNPSVVSFLDVLTQTDDIMLDLEDMVICENSLFKGKKIKDAGIREKTGLMVLAKKSKDDSDMKFNPSPEEILDEGDQLLVMGTESQINKLRELTCIEN